MSNLKEIRSRISSVDSTKKITNAMKMVASAKLKRAQREIVAMRPYSEKLSELVQNLSESIDSDIKSPYTAERPIEKILLIPISSNRGLCGAFNSNVAKATRKLLAEYSSIQVKLLTIGKKAEELLTKYGKVEQSYASIFDNLNYDNACDIIQPVLDAYQQERYDKVFLIYNRFKSTASQVVEVESFLPIIPKVSESSTMSNFIYEPDVSSIIHEILPKSLKTQFLKALKDSFASEHAARVTAMHLATDNATEILEQLKLTYNKARQAAITGEILEIVGGAEALSN